MSRKLEREQTNPVDIGLTNEQEAHDTALLLKTKNIYTKIATVPSKLRSQEIEELSRELDFLYSQVGNPPEKRETYKEPNQSETSGHEDEKEKYHVGQKIQRRKGKKGLYDYREFEDKVCTITLVDQEGNTVVKADGVEKPIKLWADVLDEDFELVERQSEFTNIHGGITKVDEAILERDGLSVGMNLELKKKNQQNIDPSIRTANIMEIVGFPRGENEASYVIIQLDHNKVILVHKSDVKAFYNAVTQK